MIDLPTHLLVRLRGQGWVVVAVLRDLMTFGINAARRLVILFCAHSEYKKGCMHISFGQSVEQAVGIRSRSVVKGQGDQLLLPIRRRSRRRRQERHQATQRQTQGDPFLQLFHL